MPRNILMPLEIITQDTEVLSCTVQDNLYFELVWVEEGSGYRIVDETQVAFISGDLFMHVPGEKNTICLEEHSCLHFIKFQEMLQKGNEVWNALSFSPEQFKKLEFIQYSEQQQKQSLIHSGSDKTSVGALVNVLVAEAVHRRSYADSNIALCVLALLNIVARNILESSYVQAVHPDTITRDVLHYINYHIYESDRLSIEHLSAEFNIAPGQFPAYFKKQYGVTLNQHILAYKIKLAEARLSYTRMSLSEIADELQFTDVSHFTKTYTKIKGHSPVAAGS
jgi:AraC family L-rhamnose operon regulatory protein RhaS